MFYRMDETEFMRKGSDYVQTNITLVNVRLHEREIEYDIGSRGVMI